MGANWITLDRTSSTGGGIETVNVSTMGNMGEERESQIVVKTAGEAKATLNITQAGAPIIGAVRIYEDTSPLIWDIDIEQNYGISYPKINYDCNSSSTTFYAKFSIDAKYIHDVVNYLADTYPDDEWIKESPFLVIRWTTSVGQNLYSYPSSIPETGRIEFSLNSPSTDLYIHANSEIVVSVANSGASIYVDLYKIYFIEI